MQFRIKTRVVRSSEFVETRYFPQRKILCWWFDYKSIEHSGPVCYTTIEGAQDYINSKCKEIKEAIIFTEYDPLSDQNKNIKTRLAGEGTTGIGDPLPVFIPSDGTSGAGDRGGMTGMAGTSGPSGTTGMAGTSGPSGLGRTRKPRKPRKKKTNEQV
jgi:hypothetical protein